MGQLLPDPLFEGVRVREIAEGDLQRRLHETGFRKFARSRGAISLGSASRPRLTSINVRPPKGIDARLRRRIVHIESAEVAQWAKQAEYPATGRATAPPMPRRMAVSSRRTLMRIRPQKRQAPNRRSR
jgi:hypothetical protein